MPDAAPTRAELERRIAELELLQRQHEQESQASARIAEAEHANRLEAVFASLPVGVAIVDERGGNILGNEQYRRIWAGIRPAADVSDYGQYKAWWADSGEPVAPEQWAAAQAVIEGRVVTGQILQIQRFDGTRAYVHNSAAPIRDASGRITGAAVVIQDITALREADETVVQSVAERKRAEQELAAALKEAEEDRRLLEALMEHVPEGITIADAPDVKIRMVSRAGRELVGRPREVVEGIPLPEHARNWGLYRADGVTPARNEDLPLTRAVLKGEVVLDEEWVLHRPDGRLIPILCNAAPIRDGEGRIVSGVIAWRDISERKQTEEILRVANADLERQVQVRTAELAQALDGLVKERQRLFDVLETLPVMICLLTPDHSIAFANSNFRGKFGEASDRRCYEHCFGETAPCRFCESFTVLETGRPHRWEVRLRDGTVVDVHDFPFTDIDGSPMILEMDVDITERRRAEAVLEQRTAELTRAVAALEAEVEQRQQAEQGLRDANRRLAGRAAQLRALAGELTLTEQRERRRMGKLLHDHLQQLLVAAKFRATVLGRHLDPVVRQAAEEVEQLLNDSIQASRSLTAELSPPILHVAGLNACLEWLGRWMAETHGLLVETKLSEDAVPVAEDVRILLFESVRELLFNAVKHSRAHSASVSLRRVDSQVQVFVSDRGVGFDPAAIARAGERGGGFGLFSIRERLHLIGGQMEIDSVPGRGSRFVLTVPVGPPPEPPAVGAEPVVVGPALPPAPPGAGGRIRVLLADDHAVLREGLAQLLGTETDIVIVGQAADGREAVELAARLSPDVILMDMSMPKLNGVEATRAIHNDYPDIRIIGLSMFEEAERAQALRDAGAVNYLTKSGPFADLVSAIRRSVAAR